MSEILLKTDHLFKVDPTFWDQIDSCVEKINESIKNSDKYPVNIPFELLPTEFNVRRQVVYKLFCSGWDVQARPANLTYPKGYWELV